MNNFIVPVKVWYGDHTPFYWSWCTEEQYDKKDTLSILQEEGCDQYGHVEYPYQCGYCNGFYWEEDMVGHDCPCCGCN